MKTKTIIPFALAIKSLLHKEENFSILEGFLSELLSSDIKIKSLFEDKSNKQQINESSSNLAILALLLATQEEVVIKLQIHYNLDFLSRMLYEVSSITNSLKEENVGKNLRVILVNIVYSNLDFGKDYIYHATTRFKGIHRETELRLSEHEKRCYASLVEHAVSPFSEYYILKASGFDLVVQNTLDEWIYYLKESEIKPEFKAKGIQEAREKLTILAYQE